MTQVIDIMKPTITGITLQEWVKTLPQNEQDDFAAAEIRRVALVNAATAAGLLTVDADDIDADAKLAAAVVDVSNRNPNLLLDTKEFKSLVNADPAVIAARMLVATARATPMYTWASEEARNNTVVTDPVWLTFWDRWVVEHVEE